MRVFSHLFFFLSFKFYFLKNVFRYTIYHLLKSNKKKIAYFAVSDRCPFCLGKIDILALATLAWAFIRDSLCMCDKFQHGRLSGALTHVQIRIKILSGLI